MAVGTTGTCPCSALASNSSTWGTRLRDRPRWLLPLTEGRACPPHSTVGVKTYLEISVMKETH